MKKINLLLFSTAIIIIFLVSCDRSPFITKNQFITKFENFINSIEKSYMTYDDITWAKVNKEFDELKAEYSQFEKELNSDECLMIDKMIGRYYSYVALFEATKVQKQLKHVCNQAEEFFNNISK